MLGQIIVGWLVADLLSGAFHYLQDHLGTAETPVLGPFLIEPSRIHHQDPLAFTKGSFLYRNAWTWVLALALAAIWYAALGPSLTLAAATLGGALSTQVHYWAHCPSKAPKIVRILQQTGALQSPKHHAAHHRPPHSRNYCVLTDWLNPLIHRTT